MTLSGLASVVTSTSSASPKVSSTARRIETRSAAGSRVGVPPPKNTVSTCGRSGPSTSPAWATSAAACPAYAAWEPPPPSSVAV